LVAASVAVVDVRLDVDFAAVGNVRIAIEVRRIADDAASAIGATCGAACRRTLGVAGVAVVDVRLEVDFTARRGKAVTIGIASVARPNGAGTVVQTEVALARLHFVPQALQLFRIRLEIGLAASAAVPPLQLP